MMLNLIGEGGGAIHTHTTMEEGSDWHVLVEVGGVVRNRNLFFRPYLQNLFTVIQGHGCPFIER